MSSKAQNPCVARKAFCPRTWPSPQENPRDCPATQFKSTPPIFPRKPNQSADLQDTTLQLTGRQCRQMTEQRLLVLQQPVVTAIELVDLGEPEIAAHEVGERGPLEPLPMQPPFASRRQQAIGDQHEKLLVPARALAARRQALRPEPVETQFLPKRQRQPAGAPLTRPAKLPRNGLRETTPRSSDDRPPRPAPRSTGATPVPASR